jgi:hypothetical protein
MTWLSLYLLSVSRVFFLCGCGRGGMGLPGPLSPSFSCGTVTFSPRTVGQQNDRTLYHVLNSSVLAFLDGKLLFLNLT